MSFHPEPQLFNSGDPKQWRSFLDDPAWAFEQKVDGMRCMTRVTAGSIEFFTRGGRPLRSAAAKLHFDDLTQRLAPLQRRLVREGREGDQLVLDAELLTDTGELVLLDLPYAMTTWVRVIPARQLVERRIALESVAEAIGHEATRPVAHAPTYDEKLALFTRVRDDHLEGVIAKRLDSPYLPGQRVSHSIKLKLTSTADVVVTGKNVGESRHSKRGGDKINYEFSVYVDGELRHIGNCSGIGKANAAVGDVIEVEYLYVGAGGKLTQPRMLRLRDDRQPHECTSEQFRVYSKRVI